MAKSVGSVPVKPMLLMVMVFVPVLVRVTVFGAPCWPTATDAQEREEGDTVAVPAGDVPVPERETLSGVELLLSVMAQEAVSVPTMVGVKAIEAVQLADAARLALQVDVTAKSPALAPVIDALRLTVPVVLLLMVMDCDALVDPSLTLPKFKAPGAAVTLPVPSPESETCCGLEGSLSVKTRVAVRVPVVVGTKRTVTAQLADAERVEPHVLLKIAKSLGSVPVKPMLLILIAALPLLVRVAIF